MVLTCPKEVSDYINNRCKPLKSQCKAKSEIHKSTYINGYAEGKQFTTRKKLGEENDKIERS